MLFMYILCALYSIQRNTLVQYSQAPFILFIYLTLLNLILGCNYSISIVFSSVVFYFPAGLILFCRNECCCLLVYVHVRSSLSVMNKAESDFTSFLS